MYINALFLSMKCLISSLCFLQVEKLRQTFLKFFPSPAPSQPHPPHAAPTTSNSASSSSMRPQAPPMGGGFYSFPMHSCRHNIQSRPLDKNPPTPPVSRQFKKSNLGRQGEQWNSKEFEVGCCSEVSLSNPNVDSRTPCNFWLLFRGFTELYSLKSGHLGHFYSISSFYSQGLLARGDLRGANVEKDEQQQLLHSRLPTMRLDDGQTNSTAAIGHVPVLSTGQNLLPLRTNSTSENSEVITGKMASRISHSAPPSSSSEMVLLQAHQNGNQNGPMVRRFSHSNTATVAAPTANFPTNPGKMNAPPNSVSSASTFSSLGYISDDRHTMSFSDPSHSRDHAQSHALSSVGTNSSPYTPYTPRSKSSLGAYSSLSSGSGIGVGGVSHYGNERDYMVAPYIPKSRSHESLGGGSSSSQVQSSSIPLRPTTLGLSLTTTGGVDTTSSSSSSQLSQQTVQCPNCRKSFTYTRGENEAFGPWFEHIKFCTA